MKVALREDANAYRITLDAPPLHILDIALLEELRDALAPFISAARRKTGRRGAVASSAPARPATDRQQNHAIREWAQQQGMAISERGRIPSNVIEAYRAAH